ncbi:unnamed protein product, partial [Staurois parvus]
LLLPIKDWHLRRVPEFDRYPLPRPLRSHRRPEAEVVLLPSLPVVLLDT